MSFEEYQQSVAREAKVPVGLSLALRALWHDGRGDWSCAHDCAQEDKGRDGSWVHAYLHRKEGDEGNAGYWYARAGRSAPTKGVTLDAEWAGIARELLGRSSETTP
jgi:hypothetical protein